MRSRILSIIMMLCATMAAAKSGKQIVVLHSNDTHSQIFPFNSNLTDTVKAGRAGFIRRANFVAEARKKAPKLLLLDSGDFSQGSTYYTMFKGDVEIGLMNDMGYDAATIGNHEFDFGLENMAHLFRMAKFPIVCANYDFTGTVCEDIVKPYTVIKRNGVRIGVFGLSPKLEGLISWKNCENVRFMDPIDAAKKTIKTLREKERCDLVICLSHLGYMTGDERCSDEILASMTTGIDLILGGHTHTYLRHPVEIQNADGIKIPIDQNGKSGIFISKFTIELEKNKQQRH